MERSLCVFIYSSLFKKAKRFVIREEMQKFRAFGSCIFAISVAEAMVCSRKKGNVTFNFVGGFAEAIFVEIVAKEVAKTTTLTKI